MIYKFTSKASGDLIMLGPQGDELMRLLGREPAAKGIIDAADMPAAIAVLQDALAAAQGAENAGRASGAAEEGARETPVALRQRLWPVLEMLRRCHAAGQPVVWGV